MTSVAEERVKILLQRAQQRRKTDISRALRIAERHNISVPDEYRIRICRGCRNLLHPGKNADTRVSSGNIKYSCNECGAVNRHGY